MQFDKETLVKQHFWILLGVYALLIPGFVICTWLFASDAIDKEDKAIKKAETELKNSKERGKNYLDELNVQQEKLDKQRKKFWADLWEGQKDMYLWPDQLAKLNDLYFGDPILEGDRNNFRSDRIYRDAYEKLVDLVKPTKVGSSFVQAGAGAARPGMPAGAMGPRPRPGRPARFPGGEDMPGGPAGATGPQADWQTALQMIPEWSAVTKIPTSEDVWLALEDLWVQRELLRTVDAANDLARLFTKVKDEKPEGNAKHRAIFESRLWTLDLSIAPGSGGKTVFRGTITNRTGQRQILGFDGRMYLKVTLRQGGQPVRVPIEAEGIPADGKPFPFKEFESNALLSTALGIVSIEEELNLRTAPIKRIDQIALFYSSSRTHSIPLKMAPFSQAAVDKQAQEMAAGGMPGGMPGAPGMPPGGPGMPPGGPGMPGMEGAGGMSATDLTPAGLKRSRYVDLAPQVRRMPVAIKMVVDQSAIQDILLAFANSRLRLQETQYHWKRFRDGTEAFDEGFEPGAGRPGDPRRPGAGVGPAGMMPDEGGRFGPGGRMGPGGVGRPGANVPIGPVTIDETLPPTLIELTVYGIASLYQRYPPKEAPAEGAPGAPGMPGMPPGAASPGGPVPPPLPRP